MSELGPILFFRHPDFTLWLSDDFLTLDLKGSFKARVEDARGNTPILSSLFGMFVHVHVPLSSMESARIEESGNVKIVLRHSKDMTLPLRMDEAKMLVDKLTDLIPTAKARKIQSDSKLYKQPGIGYGGRYRSYQIGHDYTAWDAEEEQEGRHNPESD